jgi:hypothetical protein
MATPNSARMTMKVARQPGHELKGREDQHVEDQHATPADAIGHVAEQERTKRTRS